MESVHYSCKWCFLSSITTFSSMFYVLSFCDRAKKDRRFLDALGILETKLVNGKIVVERPNLILLAVYRLYYGVWNPFISPDRIECYGRRYYISNNVPKELGCGTFFG